MPQVRENKPAVTIRKKTENHDGNTETRNQTTTADQRFSMIQVAAYHRAEKRGFQGGNPVQDWVDAEHEIDATLKGASRNTRASTN